MVNYFTPEKVNVTKRIEEGTTKKFEDRIEAERYAKSINSYVYELYFETKKEKFQSYGYAVPK